MKTVVMSKTFMLALGLQLTFSGCATVSMTEAGEGSLESSFALRTSIQKGAKEHLDTALELGLASDQSGFEFLTQVLLRGTDTIVSGDERYRKHAAGSLGNRILTDSKIISDSLATLSEEAQALLLGVAPIKRKDVIAFESAVIVTDEAHRSFVRCIELDKALQNETIEASVSAVKSSADEARTLANALAATYSGNSDETGS